MDNHHEVEITFNAAGAWLGLVAYIALAIIVALAVL